MPRTPLNLVKVSIRLFRGDKERLDNFFPQLGYNAAIRIIVRKALRALEQKYLDETINSRQSTAEIDISALQDQIDEDQP
jgi:hypothetical protein